MGKKVLFDNKRDDPKFPKQIAKMTLLFYDDGSVAIKGLQDNPMVSLGMLHTAEQSVFRHFLNKAKGEKPLIAVPDAKILSMDLTKH